MQKFILLLAFGGALATLQVASASVSEEDMKVSMLSAQTEQAGDVRPNRGGGRRRATADMPVVGESLFDGSAL
ncbi:MAG: hypothetical protein ACFB9N_03095 [Geitlerinemataceae cyanobacterium]